jgi:trigger factor
LESHEEKNFQLTFPADVENKELAGRTIEFTVYVNEVYQRILPEIDHFLATLATNGKAKTLEELRNHVQDDLRQHLLNEAETEYFNKIMESLIEKSTIFYPNQMLEDYVNEMFSEIEQNMTKEYGQKVDIKEVLKATGQLEENLRQQMHPTAINRIKYGAVLRKIAILEKIEITDSDIDAEIERRLAPYESSLQESLRKFMNQAELRSDIETQMLVRLTRQRIIDIAKGVVPSTEAETITGETP